MRVLLEGHLHDALLVRKDRFVAVAEIEAPDLDVLVGGAGYDELRIRGDVHGQDWQLGDDIQHWVVRKVSVASLPCDRTTIGRT